MTRVLSGALLAGVFVALVWFGNAILLLVVALLVGVLAFQEYAELMRAAGAPPPRLPALAATLAVIAIVPFPYVIEEALVGVGVVVIAIAAMLRLESGRDPGVAEPPDRAAMGRAVLGVLSGGFALIYIGLPLGALVGVHIFGGRGAVLLLVVTIAVSDTAQYYSGRLLGRHRLAPRLSPKKTIEGAVGGFVAAPVFLYFLGPYLLPGATPATFIPLGIGLVICGIAGDLFESMIKRAADMKDSSALIPGHGGVLDRIDALLFATLPFYMYLQWAYTL